MKARGLAVLAIVIALTGCTTVAPNQSSSDTPSVDNDREAFVGTWTFVGNPFWKLHFNDNGTFFGDDRCARVDGRWDAASPTEVVVSETEIQAEGCTEESPWYNEIESMTLDGPDLVVVTAGRDDPWYLTGPN